MLDISAARASLACDVAAKYQLCITIPPVHSAVKVPPVPYSNAELAVFTSFQVGATENVAQIASSQYMGELPVTSIEIGQITRSSRLIIPLYVVFGRSDIRWVRAPLAAVTVPSPLDS